MGIKRKRRELQGVLNSNHEFEGQILVGFVKVWTNIALWQECSADLRYICQQCLAEPSQVCALI